MIRHGMRSASGFRALSSGPSALAVAPSNPAIRRASASGRRAKIRSSASFALVRGDIRVGRDLARVDNRHVQPRLHTVVQEDRIKDPAGGGRQPEGDVAHPQRGERAGQALALNKADALERLQRRSAANSVSPVASVKVSRSKTRSSAAHAEFPGDDIVDPARDSSLRSAVLGHSLLVDGERDQRRAVRPSPAAQSGRSGLGRFPG